MALISLAKFLGINRIKSRTALAAGEQGTELWDAKGVTQQERGRLRGMWEATSATATFGALTATWTSWAAATAYSQDAIRVPTTANGYIYLCTVAGTSHASTEPTWPTVIGATVTDNTATWKCVAIDGDYAPQVLSYWRNYGGLFAANSYKACLASGTVPLVTPARAAGDVHMVEYDGFLVVCRDGEPMRVFPATSLTSSTMFNTALLGGEHWEGWAYAGGTPVVPYWSYFDVTATVDSTSTANYMTATGVSGANGAHGSAVNMDTGNDEYATLAIRYRTDDVNFYNYNIARGGLAISALSASGTSNVIYSEIGQTTTVLANFYEQFKMRFGNNMQQVMGRFPCVYRNRLCIAEGRDYKYSLLNHATANQIATSVGSYTEIVGDYTDDIAVGDDLIFYCGQNYSINVAGMSASVTNNSTSVTLGSSSTWAYFDTVAIQADDGTVFYTRAANDTSAGASTGLVIEDAYTGATDASVKVWINAGNSNTSTESTIKDYILSRRNTVVLPVVGLSYGSPTAGRTRFQHSTSANVDTSLTGISTGFWASRRPLTEEQRRIVYFAGRQANSANGIEADETDLTTWQELNSVVVGVAGEGAIVGMFAQGEYRLLVFLESALYEIVGDPPLDGTAPANFDVRRIASTGGYKHTAICSDDTGQLIYFASSDGGIYRLYGGTVERLDGDVFPHENFNGPFSHLCFNSTTRKLLCKTDEAAPYIWEYDDTTGWAYTDRQNSGQDQTGTLAALELSDGSYATNKLYESGDHGCISAPYNGVSGQTSTTLVCYKDTGDFKVRTLNNPSDEHNYANLIHGVKVQTGYIDAGEIGAKKCKRVRFLNTKPLLDASGGASFTECQVSVSSSEGPTSSSANITPERSDSDSDRYRLNVSTSGRGDTAFSPIIGDGISAIGEIAGIDFELRPLAGKNR